MKFKQMGLWKSDFSKQRNLILNTKETRVNPHEKTNKNLLFHFKNTSVTSSVIKFFLY